MNSRATQRLLWGILSMAMLLIGVFAFYNWMHADSRKLEDFGTLPTFSVFDQTGRTVTDAEFRGQIWVTNLIFTHCSSICPLLTSKMFALQEELKKNADYSNVRLASFSVDPTHDQPDTLARYATLHHADPARWKFLTGSVHTMYTVIKDGFHLPLDSIGGEQTDYPIIHSPRFVLVDTRGHIRGYYDGQQDSTRTRLLQDILLLGRERTH